MSSKETKNKSRLYLSALIMLAATAVLSTVTMTGINVFAQNDSEKDSNGNSDNVVDNGNAGEGGNGDTQAGSVSSHHNDENNANTEEEETTTDSDSESDSETTTDSSSSSVSDSDTQQLAAATDPTPGIGNNDNPLGQDNPQPGRVGSHDEQTSPESNPGGTVTDPTLCDITTVDGCSTEVDKNCFGKVISERAQDHKEDPEEGTLGSHARDPVPELPGNETPRQGIGNQDQGHPAAHGAFNSQFEDEDEQNVIDNC